MQGPLLKQHKSERAAACSCEKPMSTAEGTSKSSAACETAVVCRKRGYIPGGPVTGTGKRPRRKERTGSFPHIPYDVLDKILQTILDTQAGGLSVIKLSMVNRACRQAVSENLGIWYRLYRQWRGPIRKETMDVRTPRGVVRLRPTVPLSVPNFRVKTPPLT